MISRSILDTITIVTLSLLKEYILTLRTDLFSFAYVIIPDDLQAQQLVVDSVGVVLADNISLVEDFFDDNRKGLADDFVLNTKLKLLFFKQLYLIGVKRIEQLGQNLNNFETDGDFSRFYMMSSVDRALIYLKEKTSFCIDDILIIAGVERPEFFRSTEKSRQILGSIQNILKSEKKLSRSAPLNG